MCRWISFFTRSSGFVDQMPPMRRWERGEAEQVVAGGPEHLGDLALIVY